VKKYRDLAGDAGSGVARQLLDQTARLQARMAAVRHKVAILSGKGGVGKSALTSNLAAVLAGEGARVGVLDADLNGPSLAKMLGVRGAPLRMGPAGVEPPEGPLGIKVFSIDLLLPRDEAPVRWDAPTERESYVWRGTVEAAALREFLSDTAWGPLDFLLLDLPPGTDRVSTLASLLPEVGAAVVVTIPTEVSHLTVKRSISMAKELWGPSALGVVENMAAYVCARCGGEGPLFRGPDSAAMARELGVAFLGRIPFEPRLAEAADRGVPYVMAEPETPAAAALRAVTAALRALVERRAALPAADGSVVG
jgi:ATP-binding protein involved in chromosome partitioning